MKNKLKSFFTEHWKYMAVSTACKLNLFDQLYNPKSATQLANDLSVNEEKLLLLLEALHNGGFLSKTDNLYHLNSMSELLTDDNEDSLKYACINWSSEHLTAWQNLDFTIKTGKSSFENLYSMSFFEYLNANPDKLHAYHKAMNEYARDDYKKLPDLIDFSKHKSVMDVGGSYGAVSQIIKKQNPELECVLFDYEKVISQVSLQNIKKISGNFFEKIPQIADGIILSRILHDWNNEKANIILKNCNEALPKDGRLYIIENCSENAKFNLSLLSLNMSVMCESHERTTTEYIRLTEKTSFHFVNEIKLNELQSILTFTKK